MSAEFITNVLIADRPFGVVIVLQWSHELVRSIQNLSRSLLVCYLLFFLLKLVHVREDLLEEVLILSAVLKRGEEPRWCQDVCCDRVAHLNDFEQRWFQKATGHHIINIIRKSSSKECVRVFIKSTPCEVSNPIVLLQHSRVLKQVIAVRFERL